MRILTDFGIIRVASVQYRNAKALCGHYQVFYHKLLTYFGTRCYKDQQDVCKDWRVLESVEALVVRMNRNESVEYYQYLAVEIMYRAAAMVL